MSPEQPRDPNSSSVPDFEAPRPRRRRPLHKVPARPDFGDPSGAALAAPDRRTPAIPDVPDFQEPAAEPAATPASAAAPGPAAPEKPRSPWPARITGGVTILAILAILLAIFMPKERPETDPQAGNPTPQPAPVVTPTPNPTPQQVAPQMQVAAPKPVESAPAPSPSPSPQPAEQSTTQDNQPSDRYGTCPTCGGSGVTPCPYPANWHTKDGRLMHPEGVALPENDEFARELREDLTGEVCPFCGGSLKTRCLRCGGTGKVKLDENGQPADNWEQQFPSLSALRALQGGAQHSH